MKPISDRTWKNIDSGLCESKIPWGHFRDVSLDLENGSVFTTNASGCKWRVKKISKSKFHVINGVYCADEDFQIQDVPHGGSGARTLDSDGDTPSNLQRMPVPQDYGLGD